METRDNKNIILHTSTIMLLIFLVAFSRLIPHMLNLSPLGAISLFGAAHFKKRWQAFLIPILAVWLSDLCINNIIYSQFYRTFTWFYQGFFWQYGSYLLITLGGMLILKKINIQRLLMASMFSSCVFYFVTNFGFWFGNSFYMQNLSGLLTCYIAGIPFIKGTLLGDVFYSAAMFGSFYLLQQKFPQLKTA